MMSRGSSSISRGCGRHSAIGCALMRALFLWMARNRWLRANLPKLWFARRAVRRFMPGEDAASALEAGAAFASDGIACEFTRLGENVTTMAEADAVAAAYLEL